MNPSDAIAAATDQGNADSADAVSIATTHEAPAARNVTPLVKKPGAKKKPGGKPGAARKGAASVSKLTPRDAARVAEAAVDVAQTAVAVAEVASDEAAAMREEMAAGRSVSAATDDGSAFARELQRDLRGVDSYDVDGQGRVVDTSAQMAAARGGNASQDIRDIAAAVQREDSRVFDMSAEAPSFARPSVPLPQDDQRPVGVAVDVTDRPTTTRTRVESSSLVTDADDCDALMRSNRWSATRMYDWAKSSEKDERLKFSRCYHQLNVLVDRFANDGQKVQREVADKIAALRKYNAGCARQDQKLGYLAYMIGHLPSVEEAERARQREIVTVGGLGNPLRAGLTPNPVRNGEIDMSAPTLMDVTPMSARR